MDKIEERKALLLKNCLDTIKRIKMIATISQPTGGKSLVEDKFNCRRQKARRAKFLSCPSFNPLNLVQTITPLPCKDENLHRNRGWKVYLHRERHNEYLCLGCPNNHRVKHRGPRYPDHLGYSQAHYHNISHHTNRGTTPIHFLPYPKDKKISLARKTGT